MSGDRISRRDFLKLFGSGATVFLLGWLFGGSSNSLLNNYRKDNTSNGAQLAYAQTSGGWLPVQSSTSTVAIHIALTPTGKIFYLSGSAWNLNNRNGPYEARLLDPVTGSESSVPLSKDLFCAGQCQLPDGNILLCGGTALYENDIDNCNGRWHGARYAYEFDVNTGSLVQQAQMNAGRWYPTLVTLPDGKVLVVSGFDEYGSYNYLAEVYNPATKSWSINYDPFRTNTYCVGYDSGCPGAGSPCFGGLNQSTAPWLALYPRMILMPSGLIYTSSMREQIFLLDPSNGRWTALGLTSYGLFREYGASILLPLQNSSSERGKVMVVGGSPDNTSPATNIVEIHDFNQGSSTSPNIRRVASLNTRRKYLLPIILPNGKVMVFGGSTQNNNNPVYVPETFDPENENQGWANGPAATVPRMYHGTALLLQDGSVWTAGGTPGPGLQENRIEIFRPSYFFSGTRPTISGAPTVGAYGASITIPTPDAANVARVSLVKTGCTTHHYDTDMRLIWLPITSRGTNSITVSAPINANIAPPGYYMIHVLNGSLVPSTGKIIKIPGTGSGSGGDTTPPAQVANLVVTPVSSTQLNLSWNANTEPDLQRYNVYRGTTAGFPVNTATDTPLAQVVAPTTTYSNTGLTASTTYYYKLAAVDTSGNIGPLSVERSGTTATAADTTPPAIVANVTVTTASASQLDLGWTANTEPDLQRYNVYRGTAAGFPVNTATDTPLAQVAAPTTTYSNTGLTASTTYYYKLAAVDTSGNIGPLSTERSGTTLASSLVFYNVGPPGNSTENLRSGSITRSGEEPANPNSIIVGKSIKTLKVRLKKKGNPSGPINARIRRKTGDSIVASFNETVQSNNLSTSFTEYVFTLSNVYIITSDDRILIEYSGQKGVDIEVWSTEKFDGANTRKVSYSNGYTFTSTADMVGFMSS